MVWLKAIPWILDAVALAVAAFLFVSLQHANQRLGALEVSNDALTQANKVKAAATQSRASTEQRVRSMPTADKLNGLR